MTTFNQFSQAVRAKFLSMSTKPLFRINREKDFLWNAYLAAFPEGTDPIYITRTEHDCNCCKQFIRNIGNVVNIDESGNLVSVWDIEGLPYPYDVVASELKKIIKSSLIFAPWYTKELSYGKQTTIQLVTDEETKKITTINWNHFSGDVPNSAFSKEPDSLRGEAEASAHVFQRGLEELKPEAIETVRSLVNENLLYKGAEWKQALKEFQYMQNHYKALTTEQEKNIFVWQYYRKSGARIRNTSMGTLLIDLSEGKALEAAVKSYEDKVSGTNYKRSTALITPAMVTSAMETIKDLNLEPELDRRMAVIADVSVNNVLWANGLTKSKMQSGLEQVLMTQTTKAIKSSGGQEISLQDFIANVVPESTAMELLFKGGMQSNAMTLTTRASARSEGEPFLFKWDNDFAWAYSGNVTDSPIKALVAKAGGKVNAQFRISLAWRNADDMDLYVGTPAGNVLFYGNRREKINGGQLDVDAHCGGYRRKGTDSVLSPVENIYFDQMIDGIYRVTVKQYAKMESIEQGFTVEVEANGVTYQYSKKANSLSNNMLEIEVKAGQIKSIKPAAGIEGTEMAQDFWGLSTEQFVPVSFVMRSPNFWNGQSIGNEHFFFMLEGMKTDEPVRGLFNEFLRSELDKHRKVFEVLADKTKCQPKDDQLSGVGFSTTKPGSFVVRVTTAQGKKEYTVKV